MPIPIVVVDDDSIARYLVERAVKRLDYDLKFTEFDSGDSFINAVIDNQKRVTEIGESSRPILVLLDINMPRMNGFQVLSKLSDQCSDVNQLLALAMYTSSNHEEDRNDAVKYPFVKDYLVKPVTAEKIAELIEKYCV